MVQVFSSHLVHVVAKETLKSRDARTEWMVPVRPMENLPKTVVYLWLNGTPDFGLCTC